jgi:hypothetical protein
MTPAYLAAAAIALGHAIQINYGFYDPAALAWLTAALVCSAAAVVRRTPAREHDATVRALLLIGIAWQLWSLGHVPPAMYLQTHRLRPFNVWCAAEAVIVAAGLLPIRWVRLTWFPLFLAVSAGLGLWTLHFSPSPHIDVVTVTNAALRALSKGHSPYAISFSNIYGENSSFYSAGTVVNGRVLFGYPYPPVSLLLSLPGYLLGDYRYASLAALLGTAVAIACAIPSRESKLAAALFLTTPRIFFVLEQGWSEPMSVLLVALTAFVMVRRPAAVAPLAGAAIASKQYLVVALVPLFHYLRARSPSPWRSAVIAIATAAAVTLPFLVWSPRPFVNAVLLLQAREPFRTDSLSYLTWLWTRGWGESSFVWTIAAMLASLAIVAVRGTGSPGSFAASLAFTTLSTFAFGRKAFCNYYFFVIGALCCAIACWAPTPVIMANKERNSDELPVRPRP